MKLSRLKLKDSRKVYEGPGQQLLTKAEKDDLNPVIQGHEIVGERRLGDMPSSDMVRLWLRATSQIIKYGFQIRYADLEPPRTGTFDGLEIVLDPDVEFEMQCFILLHLFGHSVQWVAPSLENKLAGLQQSANKELFLSSLHEYEFEAAQFGMQLMREVGISDLDQWYSDFVETDWRYVQHYYRQGAIPDWELCKAFGQPIVSPLAIPELQHRRVDVRFAF